MLHLPVAEFDEHVGGIVVRPSGKQSCTDGFSFHNTIGAYRLTSRSVLAFLPRRVCSLEIKHLCKQGGEAMRNMINDQGSYEK